jgi:glutamine amidotransferase
MTPKVGVIEVRYGNVGSVTKALDRLDANYIVSLDSRKLTGCEFLLLPGVSSFGSLMGQLARGELVDVLRSHISKGKPVLGLCAGFQVLCSLSQESPGVPGVGVLPDEVLRIPGGLSEARVRVPHQGWNEVTFSQTNPLFKQILPGANFYFSHSYYIPLGANRENAITNYGVVITASLQDGLIVGAQFHPEKSQKNGHIFLRNFLLHRY